jgi:hypothetical protein
MIKNIFTVAPTLMKLLGSMAHNVFRLGDVADFQHKSSTALLMVNLAQMFHRSTSVAILPNRY